jgi:restriction system protein
MGIFRDMQRAHATQTHAQQRAQAATVREQQRVRRNADLAIAAAQQAATAADERERRRLYGEARAARVAAANADLRAHVEELETLLRSTLAVDDHIDLDRFKKRAAPAPFDPGELGRPVPAPRWESYQPPEPTGLGKVFGGEAKHEQLVAAAKRAFEQARARHTEAEERRQRQLAARREAYQQQVRAAEAKVAAHNAQIDRFAAAVAAAEPTAVVEYFGMVLGNSVYPDDFPQHYRLAYLPASRQLVVEYHLPPVDVVPAVREYRYVRVRDEVLTVPRPAEETRRWYADLIAQVSLRTVHELYEADRGRLIETVVFNGIVDTVDRRTGRPVRPCLVSLRTTRDRFTALDLGRVDPLACLRHLHAALSPQPDELAAVRPVVAFDTVDTRFSDEVDVLAEVDHRPNLLTMPAAEFEELIDELFTAMGLDMGAARPSDDGGPEWVAVDPRPIFGGRVVVHAERRPGAVDVSGVRELFGTVQSEGASKGILVSTGGFTAAAYGFASGKPLELVDGSSLLHLLGEHTRTKARVDATAPA